MSASALHTRLSGAGSKYKNKPTIVDGIRFASKLEAKRWQELKLLERAGEISRLRRQTPFTLPRTAPVCGCVKYVADFTYIDKRTGQDVVEDAKGHQTAEFKVKWAWAQNEYRSVDFRLYPPKGRTG